jgi:hypothetical protein
MTSSDLIVVTPWMVFGAVLAAVCIRLAWRSRTSRSSSRWFRAFGYRPQRSARHSPDQAGSGGVAPGRCGRGDVPAAPLDPSAGQDPPGRTQTQETTCAQNNAPIQQ